MKKVDALAELNPRQVINMYELRLESFPGASKASGIQYLRSYATVFYHPSEVPADVTADINRLEARWLAAQ